MNRTEFLGMLQSTYALTSEEVEKIENNGELLMQTVLDMENFKPAADIRELVDGAFGGNLSGKDFLEEGSKAVLIKTNGEVYDIVPKNGKDFKLDEMYSLTEVDIVEFVYLRNDKIMIVDEEGLYREPLQINWLATRIVSENNLRLGQTPTFIFGNVMLVNNGQVE